TGGPNGGSVQIGIGTTPFPQVAGTASGLVNTATVPPGHIFFGTNGIIGPTSGTPAQINAFGKDVVFSSGSNVKSPITLGSGVTIPADPPVAGVPMIHLADGYVAPVKTLSGNSSGVLTRLNTPASTDSAASTAISAPSTPGMRQDSALFAASA